MPTFATSGADAKVTLTLLDESADWGWSHLCLWLKSNTWYPGETLTTYYLRKLVASELRVVSSAE